MRELLTELTAALAQRHACIYCAVVEPRGSTPQKAGAAMLVFPDGRQVGTLGGGCIEAEVKQKALGTLAEVGLGYLRLGQPLESQLRSCLLASWMCEEAGP